MKNKFVFCILLLVRFSNLLFSQNNSEIALPNILPPSPAAAAFIRYGEYPVDMSTGVPNINVPIYVLKSGKIEVPISLSYHASGIKVRDVASTVGLGWVLNAEGIISRTILSYSDENAAIYGNGKSPYKTMQQIDSLKGLTKYDGLYGDNGTKNDEIANNLTLVAKNLYDNQSDRYAYNFNGHAGIFRFDYLNNTIRTVPYQPILVTKNGDGGNTNFQIIDENGFINQFNETETSSSPHVGGISSWMLTKIIAPDKTDEVNFYYSAGDNIDEIYCSSSIVSGDSYSYQTFDAGDRTGVVWVGPFYDFSFFADQGETHHLTKRLDSITGRGTTIVFDYATDRLDSRPTRLRKISVLDRYGRNVIHQIQLGQSYFGDSQANYRMRLDSVSIYGNSLSENTQRYSFDYNNSNSIPPVYNLGHTPSEGMCEDYWGYYNGGNNKGIPKEFLNFIPSQYANYKDFYGGNLNPDQFVIQSMMLKGIKYPTGGESIFEFEPNQTDFDVYGYSNTNNGMVGGLRIKSIKHINNGGDTLQKSYSYTRYGTSPVIQDVLFHSQQEYVYLLRNQGGFNALDARSTQKNIATSLPVYPLTLMSGSPIFYGEVTEYNGKDSVHNAGKTVYNYSFKNSGFANEDFENPRLISTLSFDRGNPQPQLVGKKIYRNNNGNFELISELSNEYGSVQTMEFNTGIKVIQPKTYIALYDYSPYYSAYDYVQDFLVEETKAYTDIELLEKSSEKNYQDNGLFIAKDTIFQYDANTLLPINKKSYTSKGDSITTTLQYPTDFSTVNPYNNMVANNILSPVIQQSTYKNGNFVVSQKTNFKDWGNNLIAPETVDVKVLANNSETRLRYGGYDEKGNVLTVSKENGIKQTYLYGYNSQYPVAKITGGDYATASRFISQSILDNPSDDESLRLYLNNLRSHLPDAMVSTFTYLPLVGMTSQTDPAGRTTYYEYDGMGRLSLVRDNDKNIIKRYCYGYAGQQGACPSSPIPTVSCDNSVCSSRIGFRCVNGNCEQGVRINTASVLIYPVVNIQMIPVFKRKWLCTYYYQWSDGSVSTSYQDIGDTPCNTIIPIR